MSEWIKSVAGAVLAASLASGATIFANQHTNNALIGQLTNATDKLSDAVTELRITVSAQNERFVTKDDLYLKMRELKAEVHNGT